ncbi:MAG: M48 family metalloprotease [Bacteroidota bacterium]
MNHIKLIIQKSYYLIFVFCLLAAGCTVNPVTGKKQALVMSEENEVALGKQSDPQVVAAFGLYDNDKMQAYIKSKGQEMAAISHRPDLKFTFRLVDSPVVNAFALPGGYVYFTRGIMAHFNNEAEFAGVLGHEIGHVTGRHGAIQQRNQTLAQIGLIAGLIISKELQQFAEQAAQGVQLLMLKNSRDHESQSDELGVMYSTTVGYDAHKMANFFQTISRLSGGASQSIPTFMSTHPNPLDRYARVHKLAEARQASDPKNNYKVGRDQYLSLIDGMVYGEDPRQGYVQNSVFYHPTLKFEFPVPRNWRVNNTPQQVQIAPENGEALIIFTFAQGNTLNEAAASIVEQYQLTVESRQNTTINGFPALLMKTKQVNQQTGASIELLSTLIQDGSNIFVFHGVTSTEKFRIYSSAFEKTAAGYSRLNDPSKINVQPERLKIVPVSKGGTLSSLLRANGIPSNRIEEFSILNGMKQNDQVASGSKIKVVSNLSSRQ